MIHDTRDGDRKSKFMKMMSRSSEIALCDLATECVYNAVSSDDEGRGRIKQQYIADLSPWMEHQYPLSRVGTYTRVTRRYMSNWVNIPRIARQLMTDHLIRSIPEISEIFSYRDNREMRDEIILDALCTIGSESYTDEWEAQKSHEQLDDVIESSTNITALANRLLVEGLRRPIADYFNLSPNPEMQYTLMDIGPGTGNTSVALFQILREMARRNVITREIDHKVSVILYDVSPYGLDRTEQRLKPFERFIASIHKIQGNMGKIRQCKELGRYQGRVNLILAGASLIHNTDPHSLFSSLYDLLPREGRIHIWDWHCGPSFAAPSLRLGRSGNKTLTIRDKDGNPKQAIENYSSQMYHENESLEQMIATGKMEVTYEINEEESKMVLENFQTWLHLWGYDPEQRVPSQPAFSRGRISPVRPGMTVKEALTRSFWTGLHTPQGFNCVEDFLKAVMIGSDIRPVKKPTAYYFIEGYGDDYGRVMRRAGFSEAIDVSFRTVFFRYAGRAASLDNTIGSEAIRFTFGRKGARRQ
jgi:SAM-dependent methyltransferase